MTRRFCDRCDQQLPEHLGAVNVYRLRIFADAKIPAPYYDQATDSRYTHELCEPCYQRLCTWLKAAE